jgi:hypothetical protein
MAETSLCHAQKWQTHMVEVPALILAAALWKSAGPRHDASPLTRVRSLTLPVPLWALGAVLIVLGPWAVQRVAGVYARRVAQRTEAALAALRRDEKSASDETHDARDDAPREDHPANTG